MVRSEALVVERSVLRCVASEVDLGVAAPPESLLTGGLRFNLSFGIDGGAPGAVDGGITMLGVPVGAPVVVMSSETSTAPSSVCPLACSLSSSPPEGILLDCPPLGVRSSAALSTFAFNTASRFSFAASNVSATSSDVFSTCARAAPSGSRAIA